MPHRRIVPLLALVLAVIVAGVGVWFATATEPSAAAVPDVRRADSTTETARVSELDAPSLEASATARAREPALPITRPVEADAPVVIAGRIVDETGAPLEGALVEARSPLRMESRPYAIEAVAEAAEEDEEDEDSPAQTTDVPVFDPEAWRALRRQYAGPACADASGAFRFADLPPGAWVVSAWMPARDGVSLELGELPAGASRVDLVLRLPPSPRVRVVVERPDGSPVEGASLIVRTQDAPRGSGPRSLLLDPPAPNSRRSRSSGPSPAETGEPIATGPDGAVEFAVPRCGRWSIAAQAKLLYAGGAGLDVPESASALLMGKRITWYARIDFSWPPPAELRVELAPARVLVGRVTNARGEPLRAQLRMTNHGPTESAWSYSSTECDSTGVFCYPGLPEAVATIRVDAGSEYEPSVAEVDLASAVQRRDFTLRRRPALVGVVRDPRGNPCANAKVAIVSERTEDADAARAIGTGRIASAVVVQRHTTTATTDAEGRFRFEHVALGAARVVASSTGWLASAPLDVEPAGDAPDLDVVVHLRTGATIEGRAYGRDGVALAQRIVHFHPEGDAEKVESALTDAVGAFRLFRLEPGRWTFELELDAGEEGGDATQPLVLTNTVETRDGATARVELAPR